MNQTQYKVGQSFYTANVSQAIAGTRGAWLVNCNGIVMILNTLENRGGGDDTLVKDIYLFGQVHGIPAKFEDAVQTAPQGMLQPSFVEKIADGPISQSAAVQYLEKLRTEVGG